MVCGGIGRLPDRHRIGSVCDGHEVTGLRCLAAQSFAVVATQLLLEDGLEGCEPALRDALQAQDADVAPLLLLRRRLDDRVGDDTGVSLAGGRGGLALAAAGPQAL